MPMQPADFDLLFAEGAQHSVPGGWHLTVFEAHGWLHLPTGRVIALEPGFPAPEPFAQTAPPGRYRVVLHVAEFRRGTDPDGDPTDERVAAARLVIRDEPVAAWEMALSARQSIDKLGEDQFFGYPVDGGLGCFADPASYQDLVDEERETGRLVDLRMDVGDRPTSVTQLGRSDEDDDEPILVAYTSGGGDGRYPTWVGRTADGDVACFLTDFFLISGRTRTKAG